MKFPSTIYANPIVEPGYYWAKCVDVVPEHCGAERPRLWIQLELGPMHEGAAGVRLCTILHPTPAARYFFVNFLNAYRVHGLNYNEAIGRWASIQVYAAEYGATKYSAIKFTYQSLPLRIGAQRLERADAAGQLNENGVEEAADCVNRASIPF